MLLDLHLFKKISIFKVSLLSLKLLSLHLPQGDYCLRMPQFSTTLFMNLINVPKAYKLKVSTISKGQERIKRR